MTRSAEAQGSRKVTAVCDVGRLPAEERASWKRFWVESRELLDLLESPSSM